MHSMQPKNCHVTVRKPISTKLDMWLEDVCTNLSRDSCLGIWPLVLGLWPQKFWEEMTDVRFLGYKSLIYEPNLTKFYTNMETIAAHKPREFLEYRLRESLLWGEQVAKISCFQGFLTGNLQLWANWGQI